MSIVTDPASQSTQSKLNPLIGSAEWRRQRGRSDIMISSTCAEAEAEADALDSPFPPIIGRCVSSSARSMEHERLSLSEDVASSSTLLRRVLHKNLPPGTRRRVGAASPSLPYSSSSECAPSPSNGGGNSPHGAVPPLGETHDSASLHTPPPQPKGGRRNVPSSSRARHHSGMTNAAAAKPVRKRSSLATCGDGNDERKAKKLKSSSSVGNGV